MLVQFMIPRTYCNSKREHHKLSRHHFFSFSPFSRPFLLFSLTIYPNLRVLIKSLILTPGMNSCQEPLRLKWSWGVFTPFPHFHILLLFAVDFRLIHKHTHTHLKNMVAFFHKNTQARGICINFTPIWPHGNVCREKIYCPTRNLTLRAPILFILPHNLTLSVINIWKIVIWGGKKRKKRF